MSKGNTPDGEITEQDVAALARYASLAITDERLPLIARELNIARLAARDLLSAPTTDVTGVAGHFDPTWPTAPKRHAT